MTLTAFQLFIAGISLLIFYSITLAGAVVWIITKINEGDKAVIERLDSYHKENRIRVDAMQTLLIRHETILSPEWGSTSFPRHLAYPNVKS
jgi:hypothetical protein